MRTHGSSAGRTACQPSCAESNLVAGDRVSRQDQGRAQRIAPEIEATPAKVVADNGPSPRFAHRPLWLFIGSLDARAASGHVTLHIANGNHASPPGDARTRQ